MKTKLLAILTAGLLLAADEPNEKGKKELDSLQGNWRGVSAQEEGKALPEDNAKAMELTIKGDKYTFKIMGDEHEQGTLAVDPAKKPKTIDIKILKGDDKGKTQQGLYEVDKDTLKLCLPAPGKERPKTMDAKEGSGHSLYVFRRPKEIG